VHASAYPLAAYIFGFQNCWSPFLAKANGKARNSIRKKYKKGKTRAHHECMLRLPIGYMKFFISKTIDHDFWPGLMVGSMIWGHNNIKQFENFLNAMQHLVFGCNANIVLNNTLEPHNLIVNVCHRETC